MDRSTGSHPTLTTLPSRTPSSSYLYPTSIPSTPSLLSRPTSTTRLRPLRSQPTSVSTSKSSSTLSKKVKRKAKYSREDDHDWITRTASTLTLTRLEEKGQTWLAQRGSSTSLAGEEEEEDAEDPLLRNREEGRKRRSEPSSRGSKSRLRLGNPTSRGSSFGYGGDGAIDPHCDDGPLGEEEDIGPDFIDVNEEDDDKDEIDVDEGEMKKVIMGRVGGWVDWAVGWLDLRGDGDEEENDDEVEERGAAKGELDPLELQKRLKRKKDSDELRDGGGNVPAAPKGEHAGTWSDAKWLLRVATMAALE